MATAEDTATKILSVRAELAEKLKRAPTSTEILAAAPDCKVTAARVRQILAEAGLQTYAVVPNKAKTIGAISDKRSPIEQRVIANIRRLYALELERPASRRRSDRQLSLEGGFSSDPLHAAGIFRRYFDGSREIGLETVAKFAALFGVDFHEILLPLPKAKAKGRRRK